MSVLVVRIRLGETESKSGLCVCVVCVCLRSSCPSLRRHAVPSQGLQALISDRGCGDEFDKFRSTPGEKDGASERAQQPRERGLPLCLPSVMVLKERGGEKREEREEREGGSGSEGRPESGRAVQW